MATKDARLDRYIESSPDFAKPILRHLRRLVHLGCPEVEETWKWSFPHFMYKGMLCGMAAFKEHCSFGFWKGELIIGKNGDGAGMGHFGRITALSDLPSEAKLLGYIREAVRLNDEGIKRPARARRTNRKELAVPDYLLSALKKNKKARATFENFSPSHRREYVEWLTESLFENSERSCGERFWLRPRRGGRSIPAAGCKGRVQRRPQPKEPPPEGCSRKAPSGFVAPQLQPAAGMRPRRASPYSSFREKQDPSQFSTRLWVQTRGDPQATVANNAPMAGGRKIKELEV